MLQSAGTTWPVFSLLLYAFQVPSFVSMGYLQARFGITSLIFFLEIV